VCGSSTTSNAALVISRVYAVSRLFVIGAVVVVVVVVVIIIIRIEVNHEFHQQYSTAGHSDHRIVIIDEHISWCHASNCDRTKRRSPVTIIQKNTCHFFLINQPILSSPMLWREKVCIPTANDRIGSNDSLLTSSNIEIESFVPSVFDRLIEKFSKTDNNNQFININSKIKQINENASSTWNNGFSVCFMHFIES
jgi:hypothetical protein